jgi:hypothetical protein
MKIPMRTAETTTCRKNVSQKLVQPNTCSPSHQPMAAPRMPRMIVIMQPTGA